MKIVSYSLYGTNKRYTINSLVNVELCKKYYSDWKCYFYYDDSVPKIILDELKKHDNVKLIKSYGIGHSRRMWRFMAYDECDIFISRDVDSHITEREVSAVEEWLHSDKNLHIMRDYINHSRKILAGMFGLKRNTKINSFKSIIEPFLKKNTHVTEDEDLLQDKIYDLFKNDVIVHDENNHHNDTTHKWKIKIEQEMFIGCPAFNNNGTTRINNKLTRKYYELY